MRNVIEGDGTFTNRLLTIACILIFIMLFIHWEWALFAYLGVIVGYAAGHMEEE